MTQAIAPRCIRCSFRFARLPPITATLLANRGHGRADFSACVPASRSPNSRPVSPATLFARFFALPLLIPEFP